MIQETLTHCFPFRMGLEAIFSRKIGGKIVKTRESGKQQPVRLSVGVCIMYLQTPNCKHVNRVIKIWRGWGKEDFPFRLFAE
jgi:hypothetical protein